MHTATIGPAPTVHCAIVRAGHARAGFVHQTRRMARRQVERTLRSLRTDLDSGRWTARNHSITALETTDLGARILIA